MTFLTWNRPMTEIPASLIAFQRLFPDDDACAWRLIAVRWPPIATPRISATSLCATPPRPRSSRQTAGAAAARCLGTATGPMSSATGPPMKFSPGSTPRSATSRAGRGASITGCAPNLTLPHLDQTGTKYISSFRGSLKPLCDY